MTSPQGATSSVVPLVMVSLLKPIVVAMVARGPVTGEDMVVVVVVFCEVLCGDGELRDVAVRGQMAVDSLRHFHGVVNVVSSHDRLLTYAICKQNSQLAFVLHASTKSLHSKKHMNCGTQKRL